MAARSQQEAAGAIYWRDRMCYKSAIVPSLEFTNVAADKDFPDVVIPAGFLPAGATIVEVNMLLKWADMMEDSASENYINAASKTIRVKASTGAWGTDDIVAMTLKNGSWVVAASSHRGGGVLMEQAHDIKAVVTGAAMTLNFESNQTNRSDAIVVLADGMTLYDVETGVRIFYTL